MVKNRRFDEEAVGSVFGIRHLQCFLVFCGLAMGYAMRVNLSVAIVAMTDRNSTNPDFPEYTWSEKTKSLLQSSFFWGYVITQIPGGQLAHRIGAKVLFLYSVLISAVLAILTPLCAELGNWQLLFAVRVIQGLCQGVLFPCTHTVLSKWAPVAERGLLCTYCYAGTLFGAVIMFATSGVLASSAYGWPSIFYVSGGMGLIWVAAWIVWGADTPDDYATITAAEKQLIESSLQQQSVADADQQQRRAALQTPWRSFFTSLPFLALFITHSVHNWCFWTMLTQIPTYMKHILGKDIKSNALLSALPYFTMMVLCFVFSGISNMLGKRQCISLSANRKIFNSIGQWIPVVSLIALGYVTAEQTDLAVILLTTTVGLNSASYLGFQVNHIDLSPNFAGVLMGISNCGANVMSVLAPLVVGFIVTDVTNAEQWRLVFFIAGGFYFFGNLLFVLFGKTDVQPWNDPTPSAQCAPQELKLVKLTQLDTNEKESHYILP